MADIGLASGHLSETRKSLPMTREKSTTMVESLTIVQSSEDADESADDVFIINDVFERTAVEPFDDAYDRIATFDLDPVAGVPIYDMVWPKFASSFNEYASDPSGLAYLIVLYEALETRVADDDVEELRCRNVDSYFLSLIADFADNEGLRMVSDEQPPTRPALSGFVRTLGRLFLVLVDLLFSLGLNLVFGRPDESTDVVFVPHPNRFGSMAPVLEAATYSYRVVVPIATSDWLYRRATGEWGEIADYDPTPIARFVTPTVFLETVIVVVRLAVAELLFGRFKGQLTSAVETEFGRRIDRSVAHALDHVYRTHFTAIPNLLLARTMFDSTGCNGVAVSALSLRHQSILFAADGCGVRSFHVPHTVTIRQEQVPKTNTTHIVASPIAESYLREEWYVPEAADVVALGRPRLAQVADERPEPKQPEAGTFRIVAATQPYDDLVRRTFVSEVLDGAADLDADVSVVVKIHPNEEVRYYEDIVRKSNVDVKVTDEDLRGNLERADLTFFINSNVAMESMILGTPCVSINHWNPRTPIRPFMRVGPIPILDTETAVREFFADLDAEKLRDLRRTQTAFVDENYLLSDDIAKDIADFIAGV